MEFRSWVIDPYQEAAGNMNKNLRSLKMSHKDLKAKKKELESMTRRNFRGRMSSFQSHSSVFLRRLNNSNNRINVKTHPVLKNDLILKEIFSFLNLEDYKQCRLVCQKWKSVGEAHFKKTVQMSLEYDSYRPSYPPINLTVFLQDAQVEFPYKSLRFIGLLPLSTANLTSLFATEAKFITSLTLKNINLSDEDTTLNILERPNPNRSILPEYNLKDILSGIENLKSLKIACKEDSTKLKLPLVSLCNIENINLENCTVELSQTTISPIGLQFKNVEFCSEDLPLKVVRINDFVNFGMMNKLILIHPPFQKSFDLVLDLVGNVTLVHLEHMGVKITNEEHTPWKVKSLDVCFYPYKKKTNLQFECFSIRYGKCNLCCLPLTVTKLCIANGTSLTRNGLRDISLPNIKYLELIDQRIIRMHLPLVSTSFKNVRELRLQGCLFKICNIDINHIPKSVETLILGSTGFQFVGEGIFSLDLLIIEEDYSQNLQFIANVTKHFLPNTLKALLANHSSKQCNRLIHLKSLLNTSIPKIMLGDLHDHHYAYLKSCPSFESTSDLSGQIVNSNGSKITFSF